MLWQYIGSEDVWSLAGISQSSVVLSSPRLKSFCLVPFHGPPTTPLILPLASKMPGKADWQIKNEEMSLRPLLEKDN